MWCKTVLYLLLLSATNSFAQSGDSFTPLNKQRIETNISGMKILGAWGVVNIITGVAGYNMAKDNEWRSFHQMNTLWGIVNSGIAAAGYLGAKKEARQQFTYGHALQRYEASKRLFLLNAGLDGLYIGAGFFLTEHAKNETNHPEIWRGYGKSILLQGAGLLLFDAVMFASHNSKNKKWYRLLEGVSLQGTGIGYQYRF